MKINIKHFCLGMLLGLVPASLIVADSLKTSRGQVLGAYVEDYRETALANSTLPSFEPTISPVKTISPVVAKAASPEPLKVRAAVESLDMRKATPAPTAVPTPVVQSLVVTDANVVSLIDRYAAEYGVDADMMKKIAVCESGMRAGAVNGPYAGIYQFLSSTWSSNRNAMGLDPDPALRYNAEEAVRTAAFKMSRDGFGAWPVCSRI